MKRYTILVFSVLLPLGVANAGSIKLNRHGEVSFPEDWEVLDSGQNESKPPVLDWVVLKRKGKAEQYLSYFVYDKPRSKIERFVPWRRHLAFELFPAGRYCRSKHHKRNDSTAWFLRCSSTELDAQEVLEYSYIAHFEGRRTDMIAHGYVLCGDYLLLVQHTSGVPVTSAEVQFAASDAVETLVQLSSPENLSAPDKRDAEQVEDGDARDAPE